MWASGGIEGRGEPEDDEAVLSEGHAVGGAGLEAELKRAVLATIDEVFGAFVGKAAEDKLAGAVAKDLSGGLSGFLDLGEAMGLTGSGQTRRLPRGFCGVEDGLGLWLGR